MKIAKPLKQKVDNLCQIDYWYSWDYDINQTPLFNIFHSAFAGSTGNVFEQIYVTIRNNPTVYETEETFSTYNVGFSDAEITNYYVSLFGSNYFCYDPDIANDRIAITRKVRSIYQSNLYKYRKLVELMGYTYNPLFNVDGVELYANAESIGDTDSIHNPTGAIKNGVPLSTGETSAPVNPPTVTHEVAPYDATDTKLQSKDVQSGQTVTDYTEYSETNATIHRPAGNLVYNDSTGKYEPKTFVINEKDNAFGVAFNGPERYYAEKRIRQGNIGVTKTQELIEAQREVVKFNILDEFFKDINEHILVGIY